MQNVIVEQWESFGKTALDAAREFESISNRVVEKLTEQQIDLVTTCLEAGMKQINLVSETKDYKDLFSAQAKLASEYNAKLLGTAKKATEILNDARDEITSWFEKGVNTAVTTTKKASGVVAKKAA